MEVNTELRLHMEKADVVNKALREDVEKLTVDWSRARDELIRKESQWRLEQEVRRTRVECALCCCLSSAGPRWKLLSPCSSL